MPSGNVASEGGGSRRRAPVVALALALLAVLAGVTVGRSDATERADGAVEQPAEGGPATTASMRLEVGPGRPFSTISAALAAAPVGATVVVYAKAGGVPYRERLDPAGDGSAVLTRRVELRAAPGERPVISGAEDISNGWLEVQPGVWRRSWNSVLAAPGSAGYVTLPDQIDPTANPAAGHLEQVFVDGAPLWQLLSPPPAELASFLRQRVADQDSFLYDAATDSLYVGRSPVGHRLEASVRSRALLIAGSAAGSRLVGLRFEGFAPMHRDADAAVVVDADAVVLDDVEIVHSSATGLFVGARDVRLHNVRAVANGARGGAAHEAHGLVVEDSLFEQNNRERFDHRNCNGGTNCVLAGLKITDSRGVQVQRSAFRHNIAHGLWCDLGCAEVTVAGNTVRGNDGVGVFYEVSTSGTITDNVIVEQEGEGGIGLMLSGVQDSDVARNTFAYNRTQLVVADDVRQRPGTLRIGGNLFAERADRVDDVAVRIISIGSSQPARSWFERFDGDGFVLTGGADGEQPRARFVWPGAVFSNPAGFAAATGLQSAALTVVSDGTGTFVGPDDFRLVDRSWAASVGVTPPADDAGLVDGEAAEGQGAEGQGDGNTP